MRAIALTVFASLLLLGLPLYGQQKNKAPFVIEFDGIEGKDLEQLPRDPNTGKEGLFIKITFYVSLAEGATVEPSGDYKLTILEDGQKVKDVPLAFQPRDLKVVLALDTGDSMREHGRMDKARTAGANFLKLLPESTECGLLFFNDKIRQPTWRPPQKRDLLLEKIRGVEPGGGTAYRSAAVQAIEMLGGQDRKNRALVILTDGLDLRSKDSPADVIAAAKKNHVRVYTVGIGKPGQAVVSSVLVLDRSGSMQLPANETETKSKIDALKEAAMRFIDIMPPSARTTLIPFSTGVRTPREFSSSKHQLRKDVKELFPDGETALFDACYAAVATLDADRMANPDPVVDGVVQAKRVVVAMTDGIDNSSRRRKEEVIARAQEAGIPLYMLGFGREGAKNELDDATMKEMAAATGGQYYNAEDAKRLLEIFENISFKIHDDGINVEELRSLAKATGGQYYPAEDINKLESILANLPKDLQREKREVIFPSLRQVNDGVFRRITLRLNEEDLPSAGGRVGVHGVVIAQMNNFVYLVILVIIGALILVPTMLRRNPQS